MAATAFDTQMLVKLESGRILPTALPTRMWTGPGPILLDVGDGYGAVQWNGTSFGNLETAGVVNVEKTAEGIPKRLSVAVGVDDSLPEVRSAITRTDLGPLTATLLFVVRETAGPSLPPLTPVASSGANPNLFSKAGKDSDLSAENTFRLNGDGTFDIMVNRNHREAIADIAVEGNRLSISRGATAANVEILYASRRASAAPEPTGLDVWRVQTDGHGDIPEDGDLSARGYDLTFTDPAKSQDWRFVQDAAGAPLVIRGRTGRMIYDAGLWIFDVENRIHDADRLLVDVWSDGVQQSRYSGDLFFEFTGELEAGLDFSWPN